MSSKFYFQNGQNIDKGKQAPINEFEITNSGVKKQWTVFKMATNFSKEMSLEVQLQIQVFTFTTQF